MSDYDRGVLRGGPVAAGRHVGGAGLRAFMLGVYNKVALGLVLSAALACVTGTCRRCATCCCESPTDTAGAASPCSA